MEKVGKWIGIGVAVLLIITIAYIVAAWFFPDFRVISRDVAIVILAVFQMIAVLLIIVLLLAVLYAIKSINKLTRETVLPKIDVTIGKIDEVIDNTRALAAQARESASTANTTTVFVAERIVSPVIRVSSLMAGVRAAASSLARRDAEREGNSQQ